jgi:hypothetical protein
MSCMDVYCMENQLQISFPIGDLLCLCRPVLAPLFLQFPVRLCAFNLADSIYHAHGISAMGGVWTMAGLYRNVRLLLCRSKSSLIVDDAS